MDISKVGITLNVYMVAEELFQAMLRRLFDKLSYAEDEIHERQILAEWDYEIKLIEYITERSWEEVRKLVESEYNNEVEV